MRYARCSKHFSNINSLMLFINLQGVCLLLLPTVRCRNWSTHDITPKPCSRNYKYLTSHSFCGSGIWVHHSWVLLTDPRHLTGWGWGLSWDWTGEDLLPHSFTRVLSGLSLDREPEFLPVCWLRLSLSSLLWGLHTGQLRTLVLALAVPEIGQGEKDWNWERKGGN